MRDESVLYQLEKAWLEPDGPPEREPIHECSLCDYGVCSGVEYIEYNDKIICYECLDQMTTNEILEALKIQVHTA